MTDTDTRPTYRALDLLTGQYAPTLNRRSAYWRPKPPPVARECYTPTWSWTHHAYDECLDLDLTTLDANAAYLSAASSANFAHGELTRTGPQSAFNGWPGYYRVDAWHWNHTGIVSPLGMADLEDKVWVAAPTVELLVQLSDQGTWPGVHIHDSWLCPQKTRLREWATAVNIDRAAALRDISAHPDHDSREVAGHCPCDACIWYDQGIKQGYAKAVQMMKGVDDQSQAKSKVRRPDWYHTIHAQSAASIWRRVWSCLQRQFTPVMMGDTDEVTWLTEDYQRLVTLDKSPLRIDQSQISLGTWKIKGRRIPGEQA